jgi:hypothetical protein
VGSFSGVLTGIFHFFKDLLDRDLLAFLYLADLSHHVFQHVADQQLCVLVTLHTLVNFDLDHLADLVCYLQLLTPKAVNLISHTICHFRKLGSHVDLLLCSSKLFLSEPAVDASDLRIKVRRDLLNVCFLSLQLLPDRLVDLVCSVPELIESMTALLAGHLVLHLYLVAHLFDLASTGVLLGQKTIDKIRHLDLKLILHVVLHATNYTPELVVIFEIRHLETAHVFLVSALFSIDKLQSLLKAHYLGLDTFKDFIQEH